MAREEEIIKERLKKIDELRKLKIAPYVHSFKKKDNSAELQEKYKKIKPEEKTKDKAIVAGRVLSMRLMGKINFASLQDEKGKIQIIVEEGTAGKKLVDFFSKYIDSGDFIGVEGNVMRTKRGELSVDAEKIEILTKAILPLPEKWHGLQDAEERFRKRYLDLIMNQDLKDLFFKKAKFWQTIRNFLLERGFLEVETPVLETSAGGAAATPFKTHHNALDADVYLRISMGELWQK